jgi:hypothetical protein
MAFLSDGELLNHYRFYLKWREWAYNKPSLKHPIKYLKWYFSEPKYEKFIKENSNETYFRRI